MAKRLPPAYPALIWLLLASVAHSQVSPSQPDPLDHVILLSMETCCKSQYWPETEANIEKELDLQDIRVTKIGAAPIDKAAEESILLEMVKNHRVDGVVLVRRTSDQSAQIAFLVWDKVSGRALHRSMPLPDTTDADSAVTTALRAVEAISAGYEEILKGVSDTPPPLVDAKESVEVKGATSPLFGAMPSTVAFKDERSPQGQSAEAPTTSHDQPAGESTTGQPRDKAALDENAVAGPSGEKAAPGTPESRSAEGSTPLMDREKPALNEVRKETNPMRLTFFTGGDFSISPGGAGVRSGFAFGMGYDVYRALGIEAHVGYVPFGPDVTKAGTTSTIDLVLIRGWARWRFLKNAMVSPAIMIGGGGVLAFAKRIRSTADTNLKEDKARVVIGSVGVTTRISITSRMAIVPGVSLGMTSPKIVLKHEGKQAVALGRPLFEWTLRIELGLF